MITIIIPIYNVEKYINKCLKSLLNQTYKNIELILVDDGSNDKSYNLAKSYENKFEKFLLLRQRNKGVSEARNLAMKYITGEYILFVDPDDFLETNMLEKMVRKIEKDSSDVVICGYKLYYSNKKIKNVTFKINSGIYSNETILNMMMKYEIKGFLWNKLFTKKIVEQNMKFDKNRYIQDWYPVFKTMLKSKKISIINESLYVYRQRQGSTLHTTTEKKLKDYVYAMDKIYNLAYKEKKITIYNLKLFNLQNYYNIIREFYFINHEEYKNNQKNIYMEFLNSEYNIINFSIIDLIYCGYKKPKLCLKIILWKIKLFHKFIN